MVDIVTMLKLVGGAILLLSNGYFVTIEFAMTRVRQFSEGEFTGSRGLERAWEMTERLEIFLSGCQVGITVSSVGLGVVAEPALAAVIDPALIAMGLASAAGGGHTALSVVVALAVINLLHVIIGEQAPTYLGVERTQFVAKYGAPILYWWTKLMWPVIYVSDRAAKGLLGLFGVTIDRSWAEEEMEEGEHAMPSTRAELRRQMGESLSNLGLSDERREEVINALEIGTTPVEEVMVDREAVIALSTADELETNLDRVQSHPHARFPLVGAELEDVRGVVYAPALLRVRDELESGDLDLADVAAPPMTVTATAAISDVIDQFQAENQELAVVLEDDTVQGLVTATDCFEAITGELRDPIDKYLLDRA
ncbi:MAG: CBS domain containing-hemolysin-like protein [Halobacteriales archaeon]|jgi:CBS domain containing-hemolysin-like protein